MGYKFDITTLAKDMKIELKAMIQYCKEIGCGFPASKKGELIDGQDYQYNDTATIAELKNPLEFSLRKFK